MSSSVEYLNSRGAGIALSTAPPIVATIALVLRGISRARNRVGLGLDDGFAVLAVLFFWAESGYGLSGTLNRSYVHDPATQLKTLVDTLKILYVNTLLTVCVLSTAKLSIIFLYKRIFDVNRKFNIAVNILIGASVAWWLACFILGIFRCLPVAAAWDPKLMPGATCYSLQTAFLITEIINCITEVVMILLPLNMVRRLHLPLRQKIGVSIIFAVGFFVVITSIVRIAKVYSPGAGNESLLESGLWGAIQMCTAICTACLPTYRGLLPDHWNILQKFQYWYTGLISRRHRSRTSDQASDDDGGLRQNAGPISSQGIKAYNMPSLRPVKDSSIYETSAVGGGKNSENADSIPTNAISVQHSVSVV